MMSPAADDALRDEVRLLGGILGDVIRDEGGQALFDHVEAVRQASIAYHRDPASHPAKRLEKLLTAMSVDQAAGLAHGFALFSLLANIAEDRATRRRAQDQAESARPYAQKMASVIANLAAGVSGADAPRLLAGTGGDQRHLIVVATAD
ncbi:phosphoenolpyruvate carboxylase, partial [Pseudomonas syringae]|uniref:phosphoenolpyruvate carboxylase n=1 Tax=Pseudomonas syringae TaxID=317 RepID=UPI000A3F96D3